MKRTAIICFLIVALVSGFLVGCSGKNYSKEVNQIVSKVLEKNSSVKTSQFKMGLLQTITLDKGGQEVGDPASNTMSMTGTGTAAMDKTNKAMQLVMNATIETPGDSKREVSMETYLVGGFIYTKVNVPNKGDQWVKVSVPDETVEKQNQVDQQIAHLMMAKDIKYLGTERVDATECYVVEITPDAESLSGLLSEFELLDFSGLNSSKTDPANLVKEVWIKQWVSKDSYLFMKSRQHLLLEIRPKDLGTDSSEFNKITAKNDAETLFYDYNKSVLVKLPEAAVGATEILAK